MTPPRPDEWVVLVDDADRVVGRARKSAVHHGATPLHRAFSLFLFDRRGRTLLQQRSAAKHTWPLVWSNACCGHPGPGETTLAAVTRRLGEELGVSAVEPWIALPDFRYRAERDGIVENEICPVVVAGWDETPLAPDPHEVAATRWVVWQSVREGLDADDEELSPWCRWEAAALARDPRFVAWLAGRVQPT